jgi:phospholipid transport system transporter-binding protein
MISCSGDRCAVQGPVTMANVEALLAEGSLRIEGPDVTVDLAGVTEVDSAAVSLLLEWRRQAQRANRRIRYVNLPANLRSLAELYGVTGLLGET